MTDNFFKIEPKAVLMLQQRHLDGGGGAWIPNHHNMILPWVVTPSVDTTLFCNNGVLTLRGGGGGDLLTSSSSMSTTHHSLLSPSSSPPFQVWILPALACAVAYALYNIFIKKGSSSINPILGGVVLQFVAAILGTIMLAFNVWITATKTPTQPPQEASEYNDASAFLKCNRQGLLWSMAAGMAIGLAEMLSFTVAGMGIPATQFIPIVIGGSVMFGAIMGVCFLGEHMTFSRGWPGIGILLVGIILVATDQGEKVVETLHHDAAGSGVGSSSDLADWIGSAVLCAGSYASYNICIKKGSTDIHPIVGGVVLQFVAALFGLVLLGMTVLHQKRHHHIVRGETETTSHILEYDSTGLFWSCMAGIAVGAAEMLSFGVSGMGVQATQSIPIVVGGSVMFGAILGVVMLGEKLMLRGCIGGILLMTGIGFVARDPGEKIKGH